MKTSPDLLDLSDQVTAVQSLITLAAHPLIETYHGGRPEPLESGMLQVLTQAEESLGRISDALATAARGRR